ncbi:hypothetical protein GCM10023215_08620 [Pseudonocardia yuanmonensis]|uniref:Uncharacterized protein n=1 Tax=Pseudonocardia yuanmonensis TaxID=1095914 RepID=A0ABP8W370_9PSEU
MCVRAAAPPVKGEERTFLLDGDEVSISATALGPNGSRIGFGEVTGTIRPARQGRPASLPDQALSSRTSAARLTPW